MERVEINGYHSNKKSSTSTINRTMSVRKTTGLSSTVIHVENGQENPSQNVEERLHIIGIPLHSFSKTQQFFVCCGGVLTFYLIYDYVQEGIFRIEGFKPYGWYLTLVQFGMYFIFGLLQTVTFKDKTRNSLDDPDSDVVFYVLLRATARFYSQYNRYPGHFDDQVEADVVKLRSCVSSILQEWGISTNIKSEYIHEMCRYGASEIHPVAAFIAGAAAQEVIKLITHQFVPFNNTFIYNGMTGSSRTLQL